MKRKMIKRAISLFVLALILLQTAAFADPKAEDTIYALAIDTLALRSGPSTKTADIGSYNVSGSYIELSERYWDSNNEIWWVHCSFSYNGRYITGWTGAKRFYFDPYDDLYDLPIYGEVNVPSMGFASSVTVRANQKLALRTAPSTSSQDVGTYDVAGAYIEITAQHWDNENSIYWLECEFSYRGNWITGWTGAKRFDISSSQLNSLPNW